jgi:MraZ protein
VFAGRFDHALDEKGRTMMPKRFRDRLAISEDRTVWMTMALDGTKHLEVRPNSSFKAYFEKISKLRPTPQVIEFKRFYFGSALEVDVDAAGRLLIPQALRARLGLSDKITFVGADEGYFEVWHPDAFDARFAAMSNQSGELLLHLAELGA